MLWTELGRLGRGFEPWFDAGWPGDPTTTTIAAPLGGREFPLMNIWVNEEEAVLTTEIPGVEADSVDISVAGRTVSLRGSRTIEPPGEGRTYHRQERWTGQFSKAVELPFAVDANAVEARFSRGVLFVKLPKAQSEKPKKIEVKSA